MDEYKRMGNRDGSRRVRWIINNWSETIEPVLIFDLATVAVSITVSCIAFFIFNLSAQ
jgi:hypothetical protein